MTTQNFPEIVCVYTGPPNQCGECGGHDETGTGFCSPDCQADRAERAAQHRDALERRRAAEDAFAAEVQRLRAAGHTDEQIDEMLKDWP